jgi:hypothetical protein
MRTSRANASRLGVATLLLATFGCATIGRGTTQPVEITSDPPGASITILPGGMTGTTPTVARLSRAQAQTLVIEKADHERTRVYVDRLPHGYNFLALYVANFLAGGVVGMAVDLANQDEVIWTLDPAPVHVELERIDDPSPSQYAER